MGETRRRNGLELFKQMEKKMLQTLRNDVTKREKEKETGGQDETNSLRRWKTRKFS